MRRKQKKYSGIIVPMITPFTDMGEIDDSALERMFQFFIRQRADVLLFGTTGETASIDQAVKQAAIKKILSKYSDQLRIYVGISENAFDDAAQTANIGLDSGAEAVVVLLPGYYPIHRDQMLYYFENFVQAINGDMFIYNIPATTHLSIPLDVIEYLSYHERIIGVKDSERDLDRLIRSIDLWRQREDFSHFIGWAAQSFNGLNLGSDGIVPSTANFNLTAYNALYEAALDGDRGKGELNQSISMEISEIYQKDRILSQSLAALKIMMNEIGLCGTKVLLPFTQLPFEEEEQIRKKTRNIIEKHQLS